MVRESDSQPHHCPGRCSGQAMAPPIHCYCLRQLCARLCKNPTLAACRTRDVAGANDHRLASGPPSCFVGALFCWAFYLPLIGTLVNLLVLYWKRHTHPWNLILLSTFTLMEAFTIGVAISFYPDVLVLQAL